MPTKKKDPYKGIPLTDSELKRRNSELVGAIEHDPILRKKALDFIHDLKIIGSEAGHAEWVNLSGCLPESKSEDGIPET